MGSQSAAADAAAAETGAYTTTGPDVSARPSRGASAAGHPGAEPDTPPEIGLDQRPDIEFQIGVDIIYHRARDAFLLRLHRLAMFGTIVGGAVAAADLAGARGPALVGASSGALDLVWDFYGQSIRHRDVARELLRIVADLQGAEFSQAARTEAADQWIRLGADVPAYYNVLRDLAFNQAIVAFGRDRGAWVRVPWWKRLLAQVVRFEGVRSSQGP